MDSLSHNLLIFEVLGLRCLLRVELTNELGRKSRNPRMRKYQLSLKLEFKNP